MQNYYNKKEVQKYVSKTDNPNYNLHNFDVPFRALCVAPSGSGNSNFICNLISLFCKGKGTCDEIHIFCKCKDEALYRFLGDISKGLIEIHEDLSKLLPINEFKPHEQTLIIFDDFITDVKKHPVISEFLFEEERKALALCFYRSHTLILLKSFVKTCPIVSY